MSLSPQKAGIVIKFSGYNRDACNPCGDKTQVMSDQTPNWSPQCPKVDARSLKESYLSNPDGLIAAKARIAWPTDVFFENLAPKYGVLGYLVADGVDRAHHI